MKRWLAVAALGAAFLAVPAWGQRHGGGSAGFGGHGGSGFHGGGGSPSFGGHGFSGSFHGGVGGSHGIPYGGGFGSRGPFSHPGFGYRGYGYRPWGYGWGGWGYPWWGWGWGWGGDWGYGDGYYSQPYDQSYGYAPSYYPESGNDNQAAAQAQDEIDRLQDEVARLRRQQNAAPDAQSRPAVKTGLESTELVFRDKHTEEIHNYAIIGQTLWVFNEQQARKIQLAELDIPATQKANDTRGVEFLIPK